MAQWVKNPPAWPHYRRHGLDPWVRKSLRGGNWQTVPVFLLEKSHGQRSLVGYSPKGLREDMTERLNIAHINRLHISHLFVNKKYLCFY